MTSVVGPRASSRSTSLSSDNASRDGSAHAIAAGGPKVRLIENPTNRGLSPAWNQAARAVDAPWILFLNPDAEICQGDLGAFVKVGERRPDVAVLGPVIRNPDGSIYESGRPFPSVVQAVGHAFLGPIAPGNPFARAPTARRAGTGAPSARSTG